MQNVWRNKINSRSVLVGKHEGKRQTGRPRRRWEDIKMDLNGTRRMKVGWIHLARYAENAVIQVWNVAARCGTVSL
jgi:hypothetical protein